MPPIKRQQYFVDSKVQGAVLLRVVLYWLTSLATVFVLMLCWGIITGPARPFYLRLGDLWFQYGPVFIAALLLLPLVALDCVRLTNRFAGPVFRLRRSMRTLAAGEPTEKVEFRRDDFWREFADDFNEVMAEVRQDHMKSDGDNRTNAADPVAVGVDSSVIG